MDSLFIEMTYMHFIPVTLWQNKFQASNHMNVLKKTVLLLSRPKGKLCAALEGAQSLKSEWTSFGPGSVSSWLCGHRPGIGSDTQISHKIEIML